MLNSATARQFRDTIFKILRVRQYRISSILSRPVQNIRLIECYLVPGHQEVVKYLYSLTFTMQISTTTRQTSNCMHIITDKLFILKILHVRQSRITLISSKYRLKKTELSCAVFQIIVLLYCFALVQLVTTISLHLRIRLS